MPTINYNLNVYYLLVSANNILAEYIDSSIHIVDAVYAPLIGGYCVVLSDGRAALLTSSDSKFHPNVILVFFPYIPLCFQSLLGVWVTNIKDALCTDVNHKFRLLLFGCENGEIAAFHLDDTNGSLVQAFRVPLNIVDGPGLFSFFFFLFYLFTS